MTRLKHPDADTARTITMTIQASLRMVQQKLEHVEKHVAEAYEMKAHKLLGYSSWGAYCETEFGHLRKTQLNLAERQELHAALIAAGMSYRTVAAVTGAAVGTVHSDHRQVAAPRTRARGTDAIRRLLRPTAARYFGAGHPLQPAAAAFCVEAGHANARGKSPCGECWELAIRLDQLTTSEAS